LQQKNCKVTFAKLAQVSDQAKNVVSGAMEICSRRSSRYSTRGKAN